MSAKDKRRAAMLNRQRSFRLGSVGGDDDKKLQYRRGKSADTIDQVRCFSSTWCRNKMAMSNKFFHRIIVEYFEWTFATSFPVILISFLIGFLTMTAMFGLFFVIMGYVYNNPNCMGGGRESNFHDAFALSWTTFSTVVSVQFDLRNTIWTPHQCFNFPVRNFNWMIFRSLPLRVMEHFTQKQPLKMAEVSRTASRSTLPLPLRASLESSTPDFAARYCLRNYCVLDLLHRYRFQIWRAYDTAMEWTICFSAWTATIPMLKHRPCWIIPPAMTRMSAYFWTGMQKLDWTLNQARRFPFWNFVCATLWVRLVFVSEFWLHQYLYKI